MNTYKVIELINQLISQVDRVIMEEDNKAIANMDKHKTIQDKNNMDKCLTTNLYNNCNNDNRVHQHSKKDKQTLHISFFLISNHFL